MEPVLTVTPVKPMQTKPAEVTTEPNEEDHDNSDDDETWTEKEESSDFSTHLQESYYQKGWEAEDVKPAITLDLEKKPRIMEESAFLRYINLTCKIRY